MKIVIGVFMALICYVMLLSCGHSVSTLSDAEKEAIEALSFRQLRIDTLFDSNQIVSVMTIKKDELNDFSLEIAYDESDLVTTSTFAEQEDALAAINGGFFNVKNGGSITYLEVNDSIYGTTRATTLFNGAIVLGKDNSIVVEKARADQFYSSSNKEDAVLITGPLLLMESAMVALPDRPIASNRHPRTCLCTTQDDIIFIAVDGRNMQADGMTLKEVQYFLLDIGCVNAVNLDGGGSTTMWLKNKGVVNYPSDITGERPVANAILITL